ncbi:hypothetical protein GJAV_G00121770 [Gymnothorax javanicus]|nr:hypothetical protein GJAV_G00121770 [Gymnothorax javanicus]
MHVSVFTKNLKPDVKCCTTCCKQYHCPICPKLKSFPLTKFARHLDVHVKNAIAFKDMFICRCNLQCRDVGHFHCPLCGRTIIRRIDMEVHLKVCSSAQPKVELPAALRFGEVELADALQQYGRLLNESAYENIDLDEKEFILEPFKFVFYNMEDMKVSR